MPDGLLVVGEGGRIDYVNPALESDFGPVGGSTCHSYLQEKNSICTDCPGGDPDADRSGVSEWRSTKTGKTYERIFVPVVWSGGHTSRLEILRDISSRLAAEKQRERLARRLAAMEERQRLARDLHDSASQALYGIALGAHTALEVLGRNPGLLIETLQDILTLADSAVSDMRFLIFELHPDYLEKEGLNVALARLGEAFQHRYGLQVLLDPCPEFDWSYELKESLYRISHEALWNTAKHAGATKAKVGIHPMQGEVLLEIEDDGSGFDVTASFPGHWGIQSMHERAAAMGGTLQVTTPPAGGTRVTARIPCSAARETRHSAVS